MNKVYELTYLISPELIEEEVQKLCQRVESLVAESGKLAKTKKPEKINLSYPIQKKNMAFLVSLDFQADPKDIIGLKNEIEKISQILRFLLINRINPFRGQRGLIETERKQTSNGVKREEKKETEEKTEEVQTKTQEKPLPRQKVELDDIEEELEKALDFASEDKSKTQSEP